MTIIAGPHLFAGSRHRVYNAYAIVRPSILCKNKLLFPFNLIVVDVRIVYWSPKVTVFNLKCGSEFAIR